MAGLGGKRCLTTSWQCQNFCLCGGAWATNLCFFHLSQSGEDTKKQGGHVPVFQET